MSLPPTESPVGESATITRQALTARTEGSTSDGATAASPGRSRVRADRDRHGEPGDRVSATAGPGSGSTPAVDLTVDANAPGQPLPKPWRPMIGSERLSQLLCTDESGGRLIG
jgi:hypothetical protein